MKKVVWLTLCLTACQTETLVHISKETKNGEPCNPLSLYMCLPPIPSSYYERADSASATGWRLRIPTALLPHTAKGRGAETEIRTQAYEQADGWSTGMPIFVTLPHPIDGRNLPPHTNYAASLSAESPTVLLDAETGERIAHFAEIDKNANPKKESPTGAYLDRGLLIWPAQALRHNHRYVVALTHYLRPSHGGRYPSPLAFTALRTGQKTDEPWIEALRERNILGTLRKAGIRPDDAIVAWDFHTRSLENVITDVLAMRERTLTALGDEGIGYEITMIRMATSATDPVFAEIEGTFTSPLFLNQGGSTQGFFCTPGKVDCTLATYERDAEGKPKILGQWKRQFLLLLPWSVTTQTVPLIHFGHGLMGSREELRTEYNRKIVREFDAAFAGTQWTGLSTEDVPAVSATLIHFDRFPGIIDRLGQGLMDNLAFVRTLRAIAKDPRLQFNAHPAIDATTPGYYGISLGGIMGTTYMSLTPDIQRGVLNVGGSTWSMLMQRNSGWGPLYGPTMSVGYPYPYDQQVLLVLSQILWDRTDPIVYAGHLLRDTFASMAPKNILYQETVGDAQVTNIATERTARTMGIELLVPSPREVYGLATTPQAPSAMAIFDETPAPPPPDTNVPPVENHVHITNRDRAEVKAQIQRFLLGDGLIVNFCAGPCIYD